MEQHDRKRSALLFKMKGGTNNESNLELRQSPQVSFGCRFDKVDQSLLLAD